jgi:hypothetical protein
VLAIVGQRTLEHAPEAEQGHYRLERAFGAFSRSLTLPDGVDPNQVGAQFNRGMLEISSSARFSCDGSRSRSRHTAGRGCSAATRGVVVATDVALRRVPAHSPKVVGGPDTGNRYREPGAVTHRRGDPP